MSEWSETDKSEQPQDDNIADVAADPSSLLP